MWNFQDHLFYRTPTDDCFCRISNLKAGKAFRSNDVPTKILKDFEHLFATFIYNNYNKSLLHGTFPEDLATTEVVFIYKKKKRTYKNNYRPVSIWANLSKIYERYFYNQMQLLKYSAWCSPRSYSCLHLRYVFPNTFQILLSSPAIQMIIPFCLRTEPRKLINSLQSTLNGMFEWCQENYLKANADKCHLFLSPFSNTEMTDANQNIASSNSDEVLPAVIDSEVTFSKAIVNIFGKLIRNSMHPFSFENIWFFLSLIIVLFYGCATVENLIANLIDYKKKLYWLYTMINAQPFISCSRKTKHWLFILGIFNT